MREDTTLGDQIEATLGPFVEVKEPPSLLWHYTDRVAFEGIAKNGQFWATDYRHLNDTEELAIGVRAVKDVAQQLVTERGRQAFLWESFLAHYDAANLQARYGAIVVVSLSAKKDDLSQWRAYGNAMTGGGYSIGINFEGVGDALFECQYSENSFKKLVRRRFRALDAVCAGLLAAGNDRDEVRYGFLSRAYMEAGGSIPCLKHHAFKAENEWRLVQFLDDEACKRLKTRAQGKVPYIEVDLPTDSKGQPRIECVYAGPSDDPGAAVAEAESFLTSNGYRSGLVRASTIPLRRTHRSQ